MLFLLLAGWIIFVTNLRLNHGWSLCPQSSHSLEDIYDPLVLHPLQNYGQRDEHSCSSNTGTKNKNLYYRPQDNVVKVTQQGNPINQHKSKWDIFCQSKIKVPIKYRIISSVYNITLFLFSHYSLWKISKR